MLPDGKTEEKGTFNPFAPARAKRSFFTIASIIGAIVLFVFAIKALGHVGEAVFTTFLTFLLVFCLRKPVAWFQRHGISRGWGSLFSMLILFAILYLIALVVVPPINSQLNAMGNQLPSYIAWIRDWLSSLTGKYSALFGGSQIALDSTDITASVNQWLSSLAQSSAGSILRGGRKAGTTIVIIFMSLIAAFWFLRDLPRMTTEVNVLVNPRHATDFHNIVSICSRVTGGYIRGLLVSSLFTGVLSGIGFAIAGVPYAAILGTLTGLMNIIPIAGPWIAGIVAAIVALFVSPLLCLVSIIITVTVRLLTDAVIQPRIMSSAVDLHPGVIIIVLMAGGGVAGMGGMIVAVPIAATLKDIYAYYFEKRRKRQLLTEDGALFKGTSFFFSEADTATTVATVSAGTGEGGGVVCEAGSDDPASGPRSHDDTGADAPFSSSADDAEARRDRDGATAASDDSDDA